MAMALRGFISYARVNAAMYRRLRVHLKPLEDSGLIEFWGDDQVESGAEWQTEILTRLDSSDVALLLITADFFWSPFIRDVEVPAITSRAQSGKMIYIPVVARPVFWEAMKLSGLGARQAVPKNAKPISDHKPQDRGFADAVDGISRCLRAHGSPSEQVR